MIIREIDYTYSIIEDTTIEEKYFLIEILSVYIPNYKFIPSFRAGFFDGKKKFYRVLPDGNLIFKSGLTDFVIKQYTQKYNNDVEIIKMESKYNFSLTFEEAEIFIKELNLPFTPYKYQIQAFVDAINKRRLTIQIATGGGKSLVASLIFEYLRQKDFNIVLIVPNINLLEQFRSDIKSYNLDELYLKIHMIGGEHKIKTFENQLTICTWQSLQKIEVDWSNIDCILMDEVHGIKASVPDQIVSQATNVEYKLGMTGTLPELYIDRLTLFGTIGGHHEYITAYELIKMGIATPVIINAMFLNYRTDERNHVRKVEKAYQNELKYLENHERRNDFIVRLTKQVAKKYNNTLLLFNKTKHGEMLYEKLTGVKLTAKQKNDFKFQEQYNVFFINGQVKGHVREKIRNLIADKDNAIIVANFAVLGTGVNIKKLYNLITASSSKSEVRVRQVLGRGLRIYKDKTLLRVFDIIDDLTYYSKNNKPYPNYMIKHWEVRNEIYQKNYFEVQVKEIIL